MFVIKDKTNNKFLYEKNLLPKLENSVNETESGKKALDAHQGKVLNDKIVELNGDIANCSSAITKVGNNVETLKKMAKGILYEYQTDSTEAYSKSIPAGAKVMDLNMVQSGKSFVEDEELVTVNVDKVVVNGKNIVDFDVVFTNAGFTKTNGKWVLNPLAIYNKLHSSKGGINGLTFKPNTRYTFSLNGKNASTGNGLTIAFHHTDGTVVYASASSSTDTTISITSTSGKTVDMAFFGYNSQIEITINSIQIEQGSSATTYSPYHAPTTITIPTALAQGKSAGTVYDSNEFYSVETDGVTKYYCKHTQRVGSVDLGSLSWLIDTSVFCSYGITNAKSHASSVVSNVTCAKYIGANKMVTATADKSVVVNSQSHTANKTYVKDSDYEDVTTFKSAMSGVMLYYELAEPIVTTVELSQNLFEALTVEGGGSITFVGNNENYNLPMANSEEYLVYLNEV